MSIRATVFSLVLAALASCSSSDAASTPTAPSGPPAGTVTADGSIVVGHTRQLRGAWIATVSNSSWPSAPGLSEDDAKTELTGILDKLAAAHFNTIFFQIRTESDALYASQLEPWSRYLTGTQGGDPGWDPLTFAIAEGHRRGLEVHAWMNPYRALVTASAKAATNHVTKTLADAVVRYGTAAWMDPGSPEVRQHILDVISDVVGRYDVDGVHFDDYFYPYPVAGQTFDDDATFAANGNGQDRDDWRRSNVDTLIQATNELVGRLKPSVRFGVSPFGIYRPGMPEGITGLDAYAEIYCDPKKWIQEGWVDYLAPQLYWTTKSTKQDFGKLAAWWAALATNGREVFIGHDVTKAGTGDWTLDEYDAQLTDVAANKMNGSIYFSAAALVEDQAGLRAHLADKWYPSNVATPPLATAAKTAGDPPKVAGTAVTPLASTRSIAVYARSGATVTLAQLLPVSSVDPVTLTLAPGSYAVSLIDRSGAESRGAPVELP